jgi:hypothetical protein
VGKQPLPPAMEGTEPVTSPVTDPETGSRDATDTTGRQLIAAKVSRAETSHMDPRPLDEPMAKPRLEAVCMPAGYLKTGTEHLPTIAGAADHPGGKGRRRGLTEHQRGEAATHGRCRDACARRGAPSRRKAHLRLLNAHLAALKNQASAEVPRVSAGADQGSAEVQLVHAETPLVSAERGQQIQHARGHLQW